jgi:hypothetical protein
VPGLNVLASAAVTGSAVSSLSCATAGACTVGGWYQSGASSGAFVVSESGHVWGNAQAIPAIPTLSAYLGGEVDSIACPDATDCTVAGSYDVSATTRQPFTADEVNGQWVPAQLIGAPFVASSGGDPDSLDVACSSAGHCIAAGTIPPQSSAGPSQAYTASESGGSAWGTVQPVAGVPAADSSGVVATQCLPGGPCAIAGYYQPAGGGAQYFLASSGGNGPAGGLQLVPVPPGSRPIGLDCTQPGYCAMALWGSPGPLLESEGTATTVKLTAAEPAITYGSEQSETLSAAVSSPAGGTPGGYVTVTSPGGGQACRITLADGKGTCKLGPEAIPAFTGQLTADYSGGGDYVASRSTAAVAVAGAQVKVSVSVSPARATFSGKAATLTFTITTTSAIGTPTGYVFVRVDGKNILPCGGGVLVAGKNTCTGSAGILAGGPHGVVAYYTDIIGSGTSSFTDGESAVQDLPVSRAKTSTTLTLAKPEIRYGHEGSEKLTVSVSHVGSVYATGKVAVKAGSKTICTITLSKGTGSCTLSTKALRTGTYRLAASYGGDGNYLSSGPGTKTLKVAA